MEQTASAPPSRLRIVPAPALLPPAEPVGAGPPHATVPLLQGTLALTYLLPGGLAAVPEQPSLWLVPAARPTPPRSLDEDERVPELTGRAALPDPRAWTARLAQAVLEVCTAGRPVAQLLRWTSGEVYRGLEQRYAPRAQRETVRRRVTVREAVRSVHLCEPADGVVEASVVVAGGERPRALALRLEGLDGRWLCTALEWV